MQSNGGKASGETRRKKRDYKEIIDMIGSLPIRENANPDDLENIKSLAGLKGKNLTANEVIIINQYDKAVNKDTKAAVFIAEYGGMAPATKLEVEGNIETRSYSKIVFMTQTSDQYIKQHYEDIKKIAEMHDVQLGSPEQYVTGTVIDGAEGTDDT
jgi:hypothetical protein